MCPNVRWHANLVLLKPVGEHATGACIGTHYPRLPFDSRLRLRRRGYVGPAELLALRCTIRGGSISRFTPPTEIQKWFVIRHDASCR
jgi:hypothetical protein